MVSWKLTLEASALGSFLAASAHHHCILSAVGALSVPAVLVPRALALERSLGQEAFARFGSPHLPDWVTAHHRQPCGLVSQRPRQLSAARDFFQCRGRPLVFQRPLRLSRGEVCSWHRPALALLEAPPSVIDGSFQRHRGAKFFSHE